MQFLAISCATRRPLERVSFSTNTLFIRARQLLCQLLKTTGKDREEREKVGNFTIGHNAVGSQRSSFCDPCLGKNGIEI